MRRIVVGVDLSLRRTAAVSLRTDWGGDFSRVKWRVFDGFDLEKTASDRARALRTIGIARALLKFLAELGGPRVVEMVVFEDYAYGSRYGGERLGEATGVCKAKLIENGYQIRRSMVAHARKVLLGKVPSNNKKTIAKRRAAGGPGKIDAKKLVKHTLDAAGAAAMGWTGLDEYDACCIANAEVYDRGGLALVQAGGMLPGNGAKGRPKGSPSARLVWSGPERAKRGRTIVRRPEPVVTRAYGRVRVGTGAVNP